MALWMTIVVMGGISSRSDAAITWSGVQWLSWNPATNPAASTGSAAGQQVFVNVTGTDGAHPGAGTSNFDVNGNATYSMSTPGLGLGAPKGGSTVTYVINLASLSIPASSLVIGISNLDATNNRGSIIVSGLNGSNQASDVNTWTTEAQFKAAAGLPSAQSLVTRTNLGNDMKLGSAMGSDNTSWGDSRGIFFAGLDPDLASITLNHTYSHSAASVSDNIILYIGIIPEPSSAILSAMGLIGFVMKRRR
jgi:hypothetical protein